MSVSPNGIEMALYNIGLGKPFARFAAFTVVTGVALYLYKPSISFNKYGQPREFLLLDKKARDGTYVPWWLPPIVVGTVAALFI
jgi:hypothetical protein